MHTVQPSVVIGTESWLTDDVTDHEVFPDNLTCYRKDRNSHGGGVFILVDQRISSSKIEVELGSCEAVWYPLRLQNVKTLAVCSFYYPPASLPPASKTCHATTSVF